MKFELRTKREGLFKLVLVHRDVEYPIFYFLSARQANEAHVRLKSTAWASGADVADLKSAAQEICTAATKL